MVEIIGKILGQGELLGTGFVIQADVRLIVTAYHVIESVQASELEFELFQSSKPLRVKRILRAYPETEGDIALLELESALPDKLEVPNLLMNLSPPVQFSTTGYDKDSPDAEYRSAGGELMGQIKYRDRNVPLYQAHTTAIWKGMSGSPAFVPGKNGIVGMLIEVGEEHSKMRGQAILVPISYIASLDERILTPVKKYLKMVQSTLTKSSSGILPELRTYVELPVEMGQAGEQTREYFHSIHKVPNLPDRFVLIGEAGSGKTATINNLTLKATEQYRLDPTQPLPIKIDLWSLRPGHFTQAITEYLQEHYKILELVEDLQEIIQSQAILFLDGLDELEEPRHLLEWLRHSNVPVVISCREENFVNSRELSWLPVVRIRPLNESTIYSFACQKLQDELLADSFMSQIMPAGHITESEEADVSQLARTPFFLLLLLDQYDDERAAPVTNQWKLFEKAIQKIWEQDRIRSALDRVTPWLTPAGISRLLSRVASENIGRSTINLSEVSKYLSPGLSPELKRVLLPRLLDTLQEAKLFCVSEDGQSVRFYHQLFAEYFAAYSIVDKNVSDYLHSQAWRGALVILAGHNERKRRVIQAALEKALVENEGGREIETSRDLSWALGEIGSSEAIDTLYRLFQKYPQKSHLLSAMARIANRLPEGAPKKRFVFETIKSEMAPQIDDDQVMILLEAVISSRKSGHH